MKVLGLLLTLALVAVALLAAPIGQPDAVVIAGIHGSSGPQAVCDQTDGISTSGCPFDDSKRIVVAGIDAGSQP